MSVLKLSVLVLLRVFNLLSTVTIEKMDLETPKIPIINSMKSSRLPWSSLFIKIEVDTMNSCFLMEKSLKMCEMFCFHPNGSILKFRFLIRYGTKILSHRTEKWSSKCARPGRGQQQKPAARGQLHKPVCDRPPLKAFILNNGLRL